MDASRQDVICSVLEVGSSIDHGTYLELPSVVVGRGRKKVFEFLKDRVWLSFT